MLGAAWQRQRSRLLRTQFAGCDCIRSVGPLSWSPLPSFGSDPQAVINSQIGDYYDVFIGILWGRFGTPTPRALSGTVEEFERALNRRRDGSDTPEVMIYFKDAPIPPSKIDPDQLRKIQEFRASLSGRGGLYSMFEDDSGFQSSLRAHLSALAQKFASEKTEAPNTVPAPVPAPTSSHPDDDLGFLDHIEIYTSRFAEMVSTLEVIGDATGRIGQQLNQRTAEIAQLDKPISDLKVARRLVKLAADDFDAYAEILKTHLPLMSSSRQAALHSLTSALTLYEDFSNKDLTELKTLRAGVARSIDVVSVSANALVEFRSTINAMPRMTSDLNQSKRAVLAQLDTMLVEMESMGNTTKNILDAIDRMLTK